MAHGHGTPCGPGRTWVGGEGVSQSQKQLTRTTDINLRTLLNGGQPQDNNAKPFSLGP